MRLSFVYERDKDVSCLLNKGKGSINSSNPTRVYKQLVDQYGEHPTIESTVKFIENYLSANSVDVTQYIHEYQKEWDHVETEFQKRAQAIFNVALPDVTAYLTVNNRNPYNINESYFYITLPTKTATKTIMHELWHFYTWYGLGAGEEERVGKQKYNDLKEALTVLLNIECKDLLPDGFRDEGYPQHQNLREKITEMWREENDIHRLWNKLAS